MKAPIVQVLFKGRMLKSVSFEGDTLRIGRMRENDIVINNLSVSRFHAELQRREEGFVLEDCGSENGCFVNGARIERAEVRAGDEILIGKHQLVLRDPDADDVAAADPPPVSPRGAADPWDGAKTYMMGPETVSKLLGKDAPARPPTEPAGPANATAPEPSDSPADEEVEESARTSPGDSDAAKPTDSGEAGVRVDPATAEADEDDPEELSGPVQLRPPVAPPERDAATSGPALGVQLDADASASDDEPLLYAGFVVQSDGVFDRVVRWEKDRLSIGRSNECDIVLADPEVSRRHALLHREGNRFEIRDLDSINGTYVNGERVKRYTLAVGDVLRLESFELTFLLERTPIGDEVKTTALPEPSEDPDSGELTMLGERSPLGVAEAPQTSDTAPLAVEPPPVPVAVESPPVPVVATTAAVASTAAASDDASAAADDVVLEVSVRAEDLPPGLREVLSAEDGSVSIPARIRLRVTD